MGIRELVSTKKRKLDDILNLSALPKGQRRAVQAFIGEGTAQTYVGAAARANISLGSLKTHLRRVRQRHPKLYEEIRAVRRPQLDVRHQLPLECPRP